MEHGVCKPPQKTPHLAGIGDRYHSAITNLDIERYERGPNEDATNEQAGDGKRIG